MILIGIAIGFYGYLIPGNINIMVLDLYSSKKYRLLFLILPLIISFESIYCLSTLCLLNRISTNGQLYNCIQLFSYLLAFAMGLLMLFEKKKSNNKTDNNSNNTLYRGIFSIIIHPQQIPFWLIIGVVINPLMKFGISFFSIVGFVFLNAIGTLLAMFLYMKLGNRLLNYFSLNLYQINKSVGIFYILIGGYCFSNLFITLLKS
jgi:hypothetical protein